MKRSMPSVCRTRNNRRSVAELTLPVIPDLVSSLHALLRQIPAGRVATYGGLAEALGSKTAARWVGESLRNHPHSKSCGCHRVVRRDGSIGLFVTGDSDDKARLILHERIPLQNGRVDLTRFQFDDFESDRPLESLIEWQKQVAQRIRLAPLQSIPDLVAGVDVAYSHSDRAVGAYVLYDLSASKVVWSHALERFAPFPYIPGFLTFRELPIFTELLEAARSEGYEAGALFVDGNGILHPRGAGIATSVGAISGVPTVGIGKKLLCGRVQNHDSNEGIAGAIVYERECIGMAMRATDSSRPIYVSPGESVDVSGAAEMARLAFRGHRLPEPLFQADAMSKKAVRLIRNGRKLSVSPESGLL